MTNQKLVVYGLTPAMQVCIKNAVNEIGKRHITDILDSASNIPTFSSDETNLILFEIGREFERKNHA